MATKPGQIYKVPLDCIASFLGIKTETLQRIRDSKKIAVKDTGMTALVHSIE